VGALLTLLKPEPGDTRGGNDEHDDEVNHEDSLLRFADGLKIGRELVDVLTSLHGPLLLRQEPSRDSS
jgi:hypothetical protein